METAVEQEQQSVTFYMWIDKYPSSEKGHVSGGTSKIASNGEKIAEAEVLYQFHNGICQESRPEVIAFPFVPRWHGAPRSLRTNEVYYSHVLRSQKSRPFVRPHCSVRRVKAAEDKRKEISRLRALARRRVAKRTNALPELQRPSRTHHFTLRTNRKTGKVKRVEGCPSCFDALMNLNVFTGKKIWHAYEAYGVEKTKQMNKDWAEKLPRMAAKRAGERNHLGGGVQLSRGSKQEGPDSSEESMKVSVYRITWFVVVDVDGKEVRRISPTTCLVAAINNIEAAKLLPVTKTGEAARGLSQCGYHVSADSRERDYCGTAFAG